MANTLQGLLECQENEVNKYVWYLNFVNDKNYPKKN